MNDEVLAGVFGHGIDVVQSESNQANEEKPGILWGKYSSLQDMLVYVQNIWLHKAKFV